MPNTHASTTPAARLAALLLIILLSCISREQSDSKTKHIFYLHGRIVEDQGSAAFSDQFGRYEFDSIVAALAVPSSRVYAEIRPPNTGVVAYARIISYRVDSLIELGVSPNQITVVGASKGAIIASNVSDLNPNAINYVLLAGNNDYQENNNAWVLKGNVLGIFDTSDQIADKNYDYWEKSSNAVSFSQIELRTGLGHGFLYRPLPAWINPTKQWIAQQTIHSTGDARLR